MDYVRAILILQIMSIFSIIGAACFFVWKSRPKMRPKKKAYTPKPIDSRVISTPSGEFTISDKRAPVDNSDEAIWEREN